MCPGAAEGRTHLYQEVWHLYGTELGYGVRVITCEYFYGSQKSGPLLKGEVAITRATRLARACVTGP